MSDEICFNSKHTCCNRIQLMSVKEIKDTTSLQINSRY